MPAPAASSEPEPMRVEVIMLDHGPFPRKWSCDMKKRRRKPEERLGRSDRYPSDYGVRDREQEERAEDNGTWIPGDKGKAGEGHSKGYGGSGRKITGASGSERK